MVARESGAKPDGKFATHLGRLRHRDELDHWVSQLTRQHDPYEVMEILQSAGVCAAVVQEVDDQFHRDRQYAATGFLVEMNEPEAGNITTENVPVKLSETPGEVRGLAPLMGQHTHEIAKALLGLTEEEIIQLETEQVLY